MQAPRGRDTHSRRTQSSRLNSNRHSCIRVTRHIKPLCPTSSMQQRSQSLICSCPRCSLCCLPSSHQARSRLFQSISGQGRCEDGRAQDRTRQMSKRVGGSDQTCPELFAAPSVPCVCHTLSGRFQMPVAAPDVGSVRSSSKAELASWLANESAWLGLAWLRSLCPPSSRHTNLHISDQRTHTARIQRETQTVARPTDSTAQSGDGARRGTRQWRQRQRQR